MHTQSTNTAHYTLVSVRHTRVAGDGGVCVCVCAYALTKKKVILMTGLSCDVGIDLCCSVDWKCPEAPWSGPYSKYGLP